ncbi:aldehyde dehydrogenase family protein [Xanthomonas arboricola pv. corylina]|uniref:2,5-dioxovalerate dehydrogenase n=1 Tax=Xanthomonas arboricola pv. corylina TaxID=487821 RepID=A0A2S7CIW4_9XANT|nr:aldehyde dehydrogenase family protein [Xanthomonas arboricola]MDN0203203.1 aldehyde dehydrogenase family protein [Xanthomonas arboricola pv. corylina]MDN0206890.1 aldehyde dehydrogenase family protein [Xanthomonas arboricola pv. corylina]MDN0211157.1 aldehyde dehydrogenase family protein [Xanthomonas arboricola pv. corylina]MDN0216192.1 aldehyde dehydrogenase family protein [Xanthomonas arboricola pv. corylina]PPU13237.1 ketoglutarate semialdehyde dehydrogenase [Xanthomonas arboricola pv. c
MNETLQSPPAQQAEVLMAGRWQPSRATSASFRAADPSTGEAIGPQFPVSGAEDVETAVAAAQAVAAELAAAPVERIAAFLDAYADALDADADTLVALAHAETALPAPTRLRGNELPRTSGQLRQAAQAVRSYSWTQPIIDTAADLRSHLAPLGKPVVVFGPNNFPFAFNAIAGSDFASAIAARNPVIAKAHPLHPATSQRMAQLAHTALLAAGLPAAAVQLLYHFDNATGLRLAGDARLGAIGFTGSRAGGLALKAAADAAGVPFYAELSSVNPVFLLPGALAERGAALAQEFFSSCTLGSGQFCTNPGVVVVPQGEAGDAFVAATTAHFEAAMPMVLFSSAGVEGVQHGVAALRAAGAALLAGGHTGEDGYRYAPTLLSVDGQAFLTSPHALQTEAFGPVSLLVRARDVAQMTQIAAAFEGNLTGTLYRATDGSDDAAWQAIAPVLRARVGRLINSKMPTGVAVSAAQNHGGPFPSTGHPGFTAVGMPGSIRRFAALHSYDAVPDALLPADLRQRNPGGVARLVDGQWSTADLGAGA